MEGKHTYFYLHKILYEVFIRSAKLARRVCLFATQHAPLFDRSTGKCCERGNHRPTDLWCVGLRYLKDRVIHVVTTSPNKWEKKVVHVFHLQTEPSCIGRLSLYNPPYVSCIKCRLLHKGVADNPNRQNSTLHMAFHPRFVSIPGCTLAISYSVFIPHWWTWYTRPNPHFLHLIFSSISVVVVVVCPMDWMDGQTRQINFTFTRPSSAWRRIVVHLHWQNRSRVFLPTWRCFHCLRFMNEGRGRG